MQNYIDVKKLSANTIAKNPGLQKNDQEKAIDAILAANEIYYNVRYIGEFTTDNCKCDKWIVKFVWKFGNKQEFKCRTGIGHRKCVKPLPIYWDNYSSAKRKKWVKKTNGLLAHLPAQCYIVCYLTCRAQMTHSKTGATT